MAEMTIVHPAVENYLDRLAARPAILKRMEALAGKRRLSLGGGRFMNFPIVGPLVGSALAHYARLIRARRVFELGSGYGYSAMWFARGLPPGGKVVCTDTDAENRRLALDFFKRAGLSSRLDFRLGDGLAALEKDRTSYDVIFMDMEKSRYPLGFAAALPRLRRGGLLIADNVLWSGRVTRPARDAATLGLKEFTRLIMADPRLSTVILPLRDGVSVSLKL